MGKSILVLDGNNEFGTINITPVANEMQLELRGVGLDNVKKVYLSFSSSTVDFGQTFDVSDKPTWKIVYFPNSVSGDLKISRSNYNISPETADGVSVVISGIRWR